MHTNNQLGSYLFEYLMVRVQLGFGEALSETKIVISFAKMR